MSDDSAAELGQRLRASDELVLEDILRSYGPIVRAVLKSRFTSSLTDTDWEDVLAIALFRVWESRQRFDPLKASLRVWFFRISENAAKDVLKLNWQKARQLERSFEPVALAEVAQRISADSDEKTHSAPNVSAELLRELLALLPDSQRLIVLADASSREGVVPSDQLSAELGLPPATIRVYRRRALERLRREIKARGLEITTLAAIH